MIKREEKKKNTKKMKISMNRFEENTEKQLEVIPKKKYHHGLHQKKSKT